VRLARFRLHSSPATPALVGVVSNDHVSEVVGIDGETAIGAAIVLTGPFDLGTEYPLDDVELLAPVKRPPKFLAIGLNYSEHVAETGRERPDFPVFFNKQSTCVNGPYAPVVIPAVSQMVDYEGELGVVIGRQARNVPAEQAASVIAGYLIVNDVSARDWQYRAATWTLGKSFDTHGPIGPWVVTTDEIPDPQALHLRTFVNGDLRQEAPTSDMLYSCFEQVAVLSQVFTLEVGDVIATGTPSGVGMARAPAEFLRPGDVVRVEVDGIGAIENRFVAEES
jgi:2-keto-4-pentenoate hydratase/2-oxohepta-3-ene-1,7-dioic acid hydratase in catechol pathway